MISQPFLSESKKMIHMEVPMSRCFFFKKGALGLLDAPPITPEVLNDPNKVEGMSKPQLEALKLGFHIYLTNNASCMLYALEEVKLHSHIVKKFLVKHKLSLIPSGAKIEDCIGDLVSGIDYSFSPFSKRLQYSFIDHLPEEARQAIEHGFTVHVTNSGKFLCEMPEDALESEKTRVFVKKLQKLVE